MNSADRRREVTSMATTVLFLILMLLTMISISWIVERGHSDLHHIDLMAGAE